MAKNDKLLLDGIIDDRISVHLPSDKRDEAFEYLAFEQVLKDYDLSTEEIVYGTIDGRQDGGIDGFFILVNGHLLQDPESFMWPRSSSELKLILLSCKHHDTFKQATLDAMIATLTELLDLAIDDDKLGGAYSDALLRMRRNFKFAYRKLSPRLLNFLTEIYYVSRGDTSEIGAEVRSRAEQIQVVIEDNFGRGKSKFDFIGATELVALHRKAPQYTLELPFVEALAKGERYVLLVRLSDYFTFIADEGRLRRHLFESNVRDFMGLNRVNEDIKATLDEKRSPDFWWLNNGVTILATSAAVTGKSIQANDVQIVNGLQTTESIFRHFQQNTNQDDDRCVLVKVIVTKDEAVRDSIIRATNNQTDVELASLHATDKIQRDIEDVLLRHNLYYERRKNFYANQGHAPAELVAPLYAAAGYVALVLKAPHVAASLRSKFMRSPASYEKVFNEKANLEIWPKIVHILKRVDAELEILRPKSKVTDKFLKGWRYITALLLVAEHFGKYSYSDQDLISFDVALITAAAVESVWEDLNTFSIDGARGWTVHKNVMDACGNFAVMRSISHVQVLATAPALHDLPEGSLGLRKPLRAEFIQQVRNLLPPQPWKPGIHRKITGQIKCEMSEYFAAVEQLIADGVFLRQRNGILYDMEGNIVSFDAERVDPETFLLRVPEL